MKRTAFIIAVVLIAIVSMLAYAQQEKKMEAKVDPAKEVANAVERGKALFNDPELGTSGMTCSSCHTAGGTKPGKMGEMTIKPFDSLNEKYPAYFMMAKRVMTLSQVINWCIMNPLKGKPLSWDDQRLADLTAYCASVEPVVEPVPEKKE